MAEFQKIPDWFIAKGIRAGGMRMAPLPKLEKEKTNYVSTPFKPVFGGMQKSYGDVLGGGDLRYWCGSSGSASYSACRSCGEVLFKKDERRDHLKKGCSKVLTESYKALLRDRKCVICDEKTSVKHFGVPLCSKDCVHEWCYVTRKPTSLSAAIDFVRGWLLEKR